jgi:hypothetical protein
MAFSDYDSGIGSNGMNLRQRMLNGLLWYSVFAWGTWFGGTLYQMLVIVPMWSASPPESVYSFFLGTDYNRTILHFFGPPFMVARVAPICISLALAWNLPRHRTALGIAVLCLVATIVFTVIYVYPINAVLFAHAGADLPGAEIAELVRNWIWADRLRFGVGVVAFVALLQAFRLPLGEDT